MVVIDFLQVAEVKKTQSRALKAVYASSGFFWMSNMSSLCRLGASIWGICQKSKKPDSLCSHPKQDKEIF
jgi:hypothetical protein